jgi:hypothetical protein
MVRKRTLPLNPTGKGQNPGPNARRLTYYVYSPKPAHQDR